MIFKIVINSTFHQIFIVHDFLKSQMCAASVIGKLRFCMASIRYDSLLNLRVHYVWRGVGVCISPWRPYDARNDIISSDHGLSHDHRRALILTNPDILLIGTLVTKPKEKQKIFKRWSEFENVIYKVAVILYCNTINRRCLLTSQRSNIT